MGFLTDYSYRRSIVIDNTKVAGASDLTNFPIVVSGIYTYLKTVANGGNVENSNGYDIVFSSDADGLVPLDFEIEKYISTTGEVAFWIRIPTLLTASDTTIYMFYGNSNISTSQQNITGVWNSNFKGVHHLNDASGTNINDSTSTNYDMTKLGATTPAVTTSGKIGSGMQFAGNALIDGPSAPALPVNGSWTIDFWANPTSYSNGGAGDANGTIFLDRTTGVNALPTVKAISDQFHWQKRYDNGSGLASLGGAGSAIVTGTWKKITIVRNYNSTLELRCNGVQVATAVDGTLALTVPTLRLGRHESGIGALTGFMDELRIVATNLSADWSLTEFNNQNSPSTFYTVGSELDVDLNPVTSPATSITSKTAQLNGNIVTTGGFTPTRRGFQINTVQYPDRELYDDGSFSAGAFSEVVDNLMPGTTYYFRAFAVNAEGTFYGSWESFTTATSTYATTINGVNRSSDILNETIVVEDVLNDEQNTLTFSLINRSGLGIPQNDQEIIITMDGGERLFAGKITTVNINSVLETGALKVDISCVDYVRLLDSNLVNKGYTGYTDKEIIEDVISTYCPGFGITTDNVIEGVTIDQINFNYVQPSQVFRRICDLTGRNWFIDYDKDIHYFPLTTDAAPFNINSSSAQYFDLNISKDASQIKNRVYVRGGTRLSDATTHSQKGDGVKRQFILPDKPHDVSITVNGTPKTVGIKNVNLSGFDFYVNFQEKYVEQDSGAGILGTGDTLAVNYTYDIPILVAVEDSVSIAANGQKEFAIFDKSISTQQAARDRASAELTDYASNLIEGGFKTFTHGFKSGQYLNINLSTYGVNADYIITKVVAHAFGAGNYYYEISLASAKTMGIIRFLIELLENNKNLIEVSDDEVVDNLLSVTDSLLSDSLTDNLTIDSMGAYATWCTDSLQSTPITRARWDLFQWG